MRRTGRWISLAAVLTLVLAACAGNETDGGGQPQGAAPQKGGTLRMAMDSDVTAAFDPQKEYYQISFAFYRCCMLRTLMSYNGLDQDHDGTLMFPDLAADEPTVSEDGLTWTFELKQGVYYAPPLEDVEITAPDFVRAIMREATPAVAAGYGFYYEGVIEGYEDFASGKSDTISGMVAVDDYTLEIHLTEPAGDIDYRFAMPATAPIPPNPDDPKAPLGVAEGHDEDYGRFLVASGPYMYEGSEALDFSQPAEDQQEAEGYQPGKLLSLVRNPSWVSDGKDDLRPAYVDAITVDIVPGADAAVLEKKVQNGELDTIFSNGVEPPTLREFQTNPELQDQIFINPSASNYYAFMNMAIAPFDDLHVRKAVNFAINKEGWRRLSGGEASGEIAGHFAMPFLYAGAIEEGYDPYATPDHLGADSPEGLESAKAEMAQSAYDSDQDGVCDAPECEGLINVGVVGKQAEAASALIASNLEKIGIGLDTRSFSNDAAYQKIFDPANKIPFSDFGGWIMDWPDAYTFFLIPMHGEQIIDQYNTNYSMLGASPEQLKKYGYEITEVASANDEIDACIPLEGQERLQCWADLDKYIMEELAPVVPLVFSNTINIVSSRVVNFTFSVFDSQTAFEQIALAPGSE